MRVRWLAGTEMDAGGRRAFSWMKGVLFSVIGIAIPAVMFLQGNGMPTGDFDPDEFFPARQESGYAEIKWDLEAAFSEACLPHEQIGGRPVYDPRDYSIPDEAHPHMGPPFYTALGAYPGLGYEVHFGLTHPLRDATEYYPITDEEMSRLDPILVEFLDKYMR